MSDIFNSIQVPFQSTPTTQAVAAASTVSKQAVANPITVKEAIASTKQSDSFETNTTTPEKAPKKKKEGPIKLLKRGIANVKKFFATVGAYAAGIAKGVFYGAISGIAVLGTGELINAVKKGVANHKHITDPKLIHSKPLAIVAASIAVIGSLWNASLKATDARSDIHDKYIGTNRK